MMKRRSITRTCVHRRTSSPLEKDCVIHTSMYGLLDKNIKSKSELREKFDGVNEPPLPPGK
jgi:hypothetical protein